MKPIEEYLKENKISYSKKGKNLFTIEDEVYLYVEPEKVNLSVDGKTLKKTTHFTEDFQMIHDNVGYDYYIIEFMGRYYYVSQSDDEVELKELKYIGKSTDEIETESYLGVRGLYELLSGSRGYADWCRKAKFMGIQSLGLCERDTLAGTLKFQIECLKNDIKPILGMTVTISRGYELRYNLKAYAKDWKGWINLLEFNYEHNVNGGIKEEFFLQHTEGLVLVIDPKSLDFEDMFPIDLSHDVLYQLDTVEFEDSERDNEYLKNLKKFVNSKLKPVAIRDSFYLDKEDAEVRVILNKMKGSVDYISDNQYMKSNEDYFSELVELFEENDDRVYDLFDEAIGNEKMIADKCNFTIDTEGRHLPEYELTKEEVEKYGDKSAMFWELIEYGLEEKYPDFGEVELARVDEEMETIEAGGFMDYFLNTRDITQWADKRNIYRTPGRGSAGGSMVSNLLDITMIDPLKYDLLFSRFLNKGRVGEDKDCDIITVNTDDGREKIMYPEDEITIIKDGKPHVVKVRELEEGDELWKCE